MTETPPERGDVPRRATFDATEFGGDAGDPPHRCDRCGRPFDRETWLTLHLGHAHPADLSDDEIERFREAHADEEDALARFRLLALGALVLIYFGLLLVYALLAL